MTSTTTARITDFNEARTRKLLRSKDISLPMIFTLKRLAKSRCVSTTTIVLETLLEYSLRLKSVDNIGSGHMHTLQEQFNKYFYHFYPYRKPKKPKLRRFCLYISSSLLNEIKTLGCQLCQLTNL